MKNLYTLILFFSFSVGLYSQESFYETLLKNRMETDTEFKKIELEADIAQNELSKMKMESIINTEVGTGDTAIELNSDKDNRSFKTAPNASVQFPSINNSGVRVELPYSTDRNSESKGFTATLSTDIYSQKRNEQKLMLSIKKQKAQETEIKKEAGIKIIEKNLLKDVKTLFDSYMNLLDKQSSTVQANIHYTQVKVQGYGENSTKLRTAKLSLLTAERAYTDTLFYFDLEFQDFLKSCSLEKKEQTVETFMLQLAAAIPMVTIESVEAYTENDYKPYTNEYINYQNSILQHKIQESQFSINAEAGYKQENIIDKLNMQGLKTTKSLFGGINMDFPGGRLSTRLFFPLENPKKPILSLAASWNPFYSYYLALDIKNKKMKKTIKELEFADKKKELEKQLSSRKLTATQIQWKQQSSEEDLSIYKKNATDHEQWFEKGLISKFDYMHADLEYKKALIRSVTAKSESIIFNIETQLLFTKTN